MICVILLALGAAVLFFQPILFLVPFEAEPEAYLVLNITVGVALIIIGIIQFFRDLKGRKL